jgi:hypothetical protein
MLIWSYKGMVGQEAELDTPSPRAAVVQSAGHLLLEQTSQDIHPFCVRTGLALMAARHSPACPAPFVLHYFTLLYFHFHARSTGQPTIALRSIGP